MNEFKIGYRLLIKLFRKKINVVVLLEVSILIMKERILSVIMKVVNEEVLIQIDSIQPYSIVDCLLILKQVYNIKIPIENYNCPRIITFTHYILNNKKWLKNRKKEIK